MMENQRRKWYLLVHSKDEYMGKKSSEVKKKVDANQNDLECKSKLFTS